MNMKDLPLKLYCKVRAFMLNREGATAIEYAVIAGLIIVALVTTLTTLKDDLASVFEKIGTTLSGVSGGSGSGG